jgi:peptide-methionine (R)-S-oxide reductase
MVAGLLIKTRKKKLTRHQYQMCWNRGTEAPCSIDCSDYKDGGTYRYILCGNHLFRSKSKYESAKGWPRLTSNKEDIVEVETNRSYCMAKRKVIRGREGAQPERLPLAKGAAHEQ